LSEKDLKQLRAVYKTDDQALGEYFGSGIHRFLDVPEIDAELNFGKVFRSLPHVCPVSMEPLKLSMCLRSHIMENDFFVTHGGERTILDAIRTIDKCLVNAAINYVVYSPMFPAEVKKRLQANLHAEKIVV